MIANASISENENSIAELPVASHWQDDLHGVVIA
jgi:hypothetical protein